MAKFVVITGEASGDLHASFLIKEIKKRLPRSEFFGIGGVKMQEEGVKLFFHIDNISVVGFWEVLLKVNRIKKVFCSVVKKIRNLKPDAVILVDFPGFNLRLAPFAKVLGTKVFYYIIPQVWAWGKWRLRNLYKNVDHALVIFPFEEKLLSSFGIRASFVGHPVLDEMKVTKNKRDFCKEHNLNPDKPIIALLPGSRKGEIRRLLPLMLSIAERIKQKKQDVQFILPTISKTVDTMLLESKDVKVIYQQTSDGINIADFAIAASGTVTLETAILGTPFVILYKIALLSYLIIKRLVKLPYIGLVNIVRGKKVIPEYIQFSIKPERIAQEIVKILGNKKYAEIIKEELKKTREMLGEKGASKNAAAIIAEEIGEAK